MDDDLAVRAAVDAVDRTVGQAAAAGLSPGGAAAAVGALRRIDGVLRVLF
jgi:hypothetical protein